MKICSLCLKKLDGEIYVAYSDSGHSVCLDHFDDEIPTREQALEIQEGLPGDMTYLEAVRSLRRAGKLYSEILELPRGLAIELAKEYMREVE